MKHPLTLMLAFFIMFLPNQLHLPTTFGVPGLNVFNLVFLVMLAVMVMNLSSSKEAVPPPPPLTKPLLIYYGILGLSLVVGLSMGSADPYEDVAVYKTAVTYSMLYFFGYYGLHDQKSFRLLLGVLLFVLAVASFEAIKEGIQYGLGNYADDKRASGPFGRDSSQSNYAGVFYGIFSSFALAIAVMGRNLPKLYRLVALGCYGLGCLAILATFSRQSFLIIGATTALVALRRNPLLAVVAIAGMLAYPLWAPEGVVERIEMTTAEEGTIEGVELEQSAASRYVLWDGAFDLIKRNPVFGVGFNQFQEEVEPYLDETIEARDAQNQYLRIGAESGLPGLAAYVFLLISLFSIGSRLTAVTHVPNARVFGFAMKIAVVAVCMGNIYSSTFFSGEVMGNFWVLAGMLSRYRLLVDEESVAPESLSPFHGNRLEQVRHVYARWQGSQHEREVES